MAILSAAEILAADDAVTRTVPVPEWGGDVIVRALSGTERDAFEASMWTSGKLDRTNYRSKLLVRALTTEGGARLFTDTQASDLGKHNAAIIERLYDVASTLSGLSDEDQEAMAGNSETEGGGDSSSPSPATSDAPAQNS